MPSAWATVIAVADCPSPAGWRQAHCPLPRASASGHASASAGPPPNAPHLLGGDEAVGVKAPRFSICTGHGLETGRPLQTPVSSEQHGEVTELAGGEDLAGGEESQSCRMDTGQCMHARIRAGVTSQPGISPCTGTIAFGAQSLFKLTDNEGRGLGA